MLATSLESLNLKIHGGEVVHSVARISVSKHSSTLLLAKSAVYNCVGVKEKAI